MYSKETKQELYCMCITLDLRRYSMESEKIIKIYCSNDKATREHIWYSHPNLRAQFDYLENKMPCLKTKKGKHQIRKNKAVNPPRTSRFSRLSTVIGWLWF